MSIFFLNPPEIVNILPVLLAGFDNVERPLHTTLLSIAFFVDFIIGCYYGRLNQFAVFFVIADMRFNH